MIIQIAMDDAGGWKESDHPRDSAGKFTAGGAVMSSLASKGWSKFSDQGGSATYVSENGKSQLTVNKETGAFAGLIDGFSVQGEGKAELPAHLQSSAPKPSAAGQSSASEPAPMTSAQQSYIVNSHVGKIIGAAGFKKVKSADGVLKFEHPSGAKVVIHPPAPDKKSSSEWTHFSPGMKEGEKGSGVAIQKLLGAAVAKAEAAKPAAEPAAKPGGSLSPAAVAPPEPAPAEAPKKVYYSGAKHPDLQEHLVDKSDPKKGVNLKSYLATKGYTTVSKIAPDVAKLSKPNGDSVEMNTKTGEWLAKSKGHLTKEGQGTDSLAQLLSGKPAVIGPGEKAPWANSQKTTLDPAAIEKQKAAQAAKYAQAKEYDETQQKLAAAAPKPTPKQEKAVAKYTGSAYAAWNEKLRHDPDFEDEATKQVDEYLAKSEFPENVTIYRKVSGEYSKILKSILIEGTKFVDHGYVSTSTHKGTWSGDLQFVIDVKKGQKGASIKDVSKHEGENEVLLPRSSAFVVKKFDRKAGLVHVELDQKHLEHKWKKD